MFDDLISENSSPRELAASLGSFWSGQFGGRQNVFDLMAAKCVAEKQWKVDFNEMVSSVNRFKQPIFHEERWFFVELAESQMNVGQTAQHVYGGDVAYGGGELYGDYRNDETYSWDWDLPVVDSAGLAGGILAPRHYLVRGTDFQVKPGGITVFSNPFDSDWPFREERDDTGELVDRYLQVWLVNAWVDREDIFRQWGYQLRLRLPSSEAYLGYLNAMYDAAIAGTTDEILRRMVGVAFGIPTAAGQELVSAVEYGRNHLLVVTDSSVYQFSKNDSPVVASGDTINAGDTLTTGLQFFNCHRGDVPPSSVLPGFVTGPEYSPPGVGPLLWQNADVPVTAEAVGDELYVSFDLLGDEDDVKAILDQLNAGNLLASYLDTRKQPVAVAGCSVDPLPPPLPTHMPATINPLELLIKIPFRRSVTFAVIDVAAAEHSMRGWSFSDLRRVVPPHCSLILLTRYSSEIEFGLSDPSTHTGTSSIIDVSTSEITFESTNLSGSSTLHQQDQKCQ